METIRTYLENMFMNLPDTAEVLRAREELLQMMEDKYNELKAEGKTENEAVGIVISEFGNLDEVAQSLGLSSYMKKERQEYDEDGDYEQEEDYRRVTLPVVREYVEESVRYAGRLGIAVSLCICSPILLIVLGGVSEATGVIDEDAALAIGILFLFIMAAAAVGMIIYFSMKQERYEWVEKDIYHLDYQSQRYLQEEKNEFQGAFAICITMGVILCILSVIPLVAAGFVADDNEMVLTICVGVLLFLVSVGVFLFIFAGIRQETYEKMLKAGDNRKKKKRSRLIKD